MRRLQGKDKPEGTVTFKNPYTPPVDDDPDRTLDKGHDMEKAGRRRRWPSPTPPRTKDTKADRARPKIDLKEPEKDPRGDDPASYFESPFAPYKRVEMALLQLMQNGTLSKHYPGDAGYDHQEAEINRIRRTDPDRHAEAIEPARYPGKGGKSAYQQTREQADEVSGEQWGGGEGIATPGTGPASRGDRPANVSTTEDMHDEENIAQRPKGVGNKPDFLEPRGLYSKRGGGTRQDEFRPGYKEGRVDRHVGDSPRAMTNLSIDKNQAGSGGSGQAEQGGTTPPTQSTRDSARKAGQKQQRYGDEAFKPKNMEKRRTEMMQKSLESALLKMMQFGG